MSATQEAARSGRTVSVMCRLPMGIHLDLYDMEALKVRNDARQTNVTPIPPSRRVRLRGARTDQRFHRRDNRMLGMAGRTDVDAEFWDAWLKQNSGSDLVRQNLVFAERTGARAQDAARDFSSEPTGFEGLDPDNLPVTGVTRRDEDEAA